MDWIPLMVNSFVIVPKGMNNQDSSYPGREGRAGGGCWGGGRLRGLRIFSYMISEMDKRVYSRIHSQSL